MIWIRRNRCWQSNDEHEALLANRLVAEASEAQQELLNSAPEGCYMVLVTDGLALLPPGTPRAAIEAALIMASRRAAERLN